LGLKKVAATKQLFRSVHGMLGGGPAKQNPANNNDLVGSAAERPSIQRKGNRILEIYKKKKNKNTKKRQKEP